MAFQLSNTSNTTALLLLAPVVLLVLLLVRYNRLRHIPGPLLPSLTDLWLQSRIWRGENVAEIVPELHKKYGPILRWGPNRVSFASDAAIPAIYSMKDIFPKSASYQPMVELAQGKEVPTLVTIRDDKHMSAIKSQVSAGFSQNTWLKQEDQMDHTLEVFVRRLREISRAGEADIQMDHWLSLWTFDTLSQLAFSDSRNYLDAGIDKDGVYAGSIVRFLHWCNWQLLPNLESWLYKGWLSQRMKRTTSALVRLAMARIEERKKDGGEMAGRDLIGRFLAASQQNPQIIAPRDVLALTISTIHAGAETTSLTSSHVLANLLTHPMVYERLEKDILDAGMNFPPQFKDVAGLQYLDAVIRESMRYTPLSGINVERTTTHDTIICGVPIPKGTDVSVSPGETSHNTNVFGADADAFRPERWIEATDQQWREMDRASMVFSYGPRICMGRHLANIEMRKVIAAIIMTFKLRLVCEPVAKWEAIIQKVDLKVRLEPRG